MKKEQKDLEDKVSDEAREKKKEEIFSLADIYCKPKRTKHAPKKDLPQKFKKGNKVGVRFGEGQSMEGNGRPKKPETILEAMKEAAEKYGFSAVEIAKEILAIGMDKEVDPKVRFPFLKEANLRIFGTPHGSIEESIHALNNRVDKLFELTVPMLEATAQNDGLKIVSELVKQGKLEQVLKRIKQDSEQSG